MKITKVEIPGLLIIEPRVFEDKRGEFMETFSLKKLDEQIPNLSFVQDNESVSKKGVFRGLHFQKPPHAQAKLVRVTQGRVMDYALDLRHESETFKNLYQIELSADNRKMLYIPKGFAHGFQALEENTFFQYKCSNYYEPSAEGGIFYETVPGLNLESKNPITNEKDRQLEKLDKFITPF